MGHQGQQYICRSCNHLEGFVEFCPFDKKLTKQRFCQNRGSMGRPVLSLSAANKGPQMTKHWEYLWRSRITFAAQPKSWRLITLAPLC